MKVLVIDRDEIRLEELERAIKSANSKEALQRIRVELIELKSATLHKRLCARINTAISLIKRELHTATTAGFDRAFVDVAKEVLPNEMFRQIAVAAKSLSGAYEQRALERAADAAPMRFDPTELFRDFGRDFALEVWRSTPAKNRAQTGAEFRQQLIAAGGSPKKRIKSAK